MSTKSGADMFPQLRGVLRRMAAVLVDREEFRVRSRMLAYENVGSMIGASGYWVRSLVNDYDGASNISFAIGLNLMALYERLCERIEADNYEAAQRIAKLQQEIHAASPRALQEIVVGAGGMAAETKEAKPGDAALPTASGEGEA